MSADYNQVIVGKRIKKIRKDKKCTQKELAEALDISVAHLSNLETGKKKLTFDLMSKLCIYFDVSSDYFIAGMLHSNNVPENIKDMLEQCNEEQIKFVELLLKIILDSSYFS
ncbi:MAG: helix-turn-helix transcriptional regulator [Coprococcus sp.]|nr:helix-turn-helix transcriptional regulator [Coprococcus sp.]